MTKANLKLCGFHDKLDNHHNDCVWQPEVQHQEAEGSDPKAGGYPNHQPSQRLYLATGRTPRSRREATSPTNTREGNQSWLSSQ
jgi:hypothetical protein